MSKRIAYITGAVLVIPTSVWHGFVFSKLWNWFAEPMGALHCSVLSACGLSLLVPLLRHFSNPIVGKEPLGTDKTGKQIMIEFCVKRILLPAFILGLACFYILFDKYCLKHC